MRGKLQFSFLIILFVVFVSISPSHAAAPNVTGTWEDSICNLLPLSSNIYRQRKIEFGDLANSSLPSAQLQGTWKETINYFQDNECVANEVDFTTIISGSYIVGSAAKLQQFYNIDYRISSKLLIVYNEETVNYITGLTKCSLTDLIPNVYYDINEVQCPALYQLPIRSCPAIKDIVRRDESTLWVGSSFPGNPPAWSPPCQTTRNSIYDKYSLSFFQTVKEEIINYQFVDGFLDFDNSGQNTEVTSDDILYIGNHLQSSVVVASSSSLFFSFFLLFICVIFV